MKKRYKRFTAVLLAVVLITCMFSIIPAQAVSDEAQIVGASSGTTGDCTWTLDDDGTLTISGSGAMEDYNDLDSVPWANYDDELHYYINSRIKSVVIKDGVTNIGKHAFDFSPELISVTIPNSVKTIADFAFCYCTGLKSLIIPNNVKSIGSNAFSNCHELTSIVIPDSVTSLGFSAFMDCSGLTNISLSDNIEIIRAQTFLDCTSLKSIIIPNSVTSIESNAFIDCTGLTNVTIGNGVAIIGGDAFRNCTSLDNVTIPNSVKKIERAAFYDCKSLTSITIPESITTIEQATFKGCTSLKSVTIPKSITKICDYAFHNCESLSGVYISDLTAWCNIHFGDPYNGGTPLAYTSNLYLNNVLITNLVIPDSVKEIQGYAFYNCKNFFSITIPETVTTINHYAFCKCTNLTNISIPNSVTFLGGGLFSDCTGLISVSIPNSITSIPFNAFWGCTHLTNISIPTNVTSIGEHAFSRTKLTNIIIPDSAASIGRYAFSYCKNLRSITIPMTVNYFATGLFSGDENLCDIYYGGSKDNWEKIQYEDIYGNDRKFMNTITIHYNYNYSSGHIINSVYGEDHNFSFGNDEEIEDLVFSKASTEYNPRLAHFLACMARSAYTRELANNNYVKLGFRKINQYHYGGADPYAGFTIGEKSLDNGNKIVMITIKGSSNLFDPYDNNNWTQTNFNFGNNTMLLSVGLHSGFTASADEVYNSLKEYLGGSIPTKGVTYVITGHSLGAAVGNILSEKLDLDSVPNQNVYNYNFACPNVGMGSDDISVWNNQGKHNNIINIGNWCDFVSHMPGVGMESLSVANRELCLYKGWTKWKRFGVSYWFDNGFHLAVQAHDMETYLDYLEKEYDETHFRDKEYEVQAVSVYCPVDVDVYDNQGNPIAGTTNNSPNYYENEPGEKAFVIVNGDRKLIYIIGNDSFDIRLHGTDTGEMEFSVSSENLTTGETNSKKSFDSVQLVNNKEMVSTVVDTSDVKYTQLFSVDDENKLTSEILTDGTEVNPISISESRLELSYGSEVTLTAESIDEYRWYSTDESVATVQNGIVTVCGSGEANIIAETVNGARAICKIIVPVILGDVNNDGQITVADATLVQKHAAEMITLEGAAMEAADTNKDGYITVADATLIQKYAAEMIDSF